MIHIHILARLKGVMERKNAVCKSADPAGLTASALSAEEI
jgi:hypothetical protein